MDHPELLARDDALEHVLSVRANALENRPTEAVTLDRIGGRILATDVVAETDLPPHSHATMDGYAFDATRSYPFDVVEAEVYPEDDPPAIEPGEAVRIATGAPLPAQANAVLKREEATVEQGELSGTPTEPGTYTYQQGSNVEAGETLFSTGERLAPRDAILLRDLGIERATVYDSHSVGILATGTEIHEGRSADLDSPMLAGLVRSWGHEPHLEGTVPDKYDRVIDRIDAVASEHDVVVTTGGTSVGHKDYVIRALDELGELRFHGVRVRPGKPIALAELPDHDATAFAIPGKPVGAHTIATAVARPFFTGNRQLPTVPATLSTDVGIGREGFEYWIPVVLEDASPDDSTRAAPEPSDLVATPLGHVDSACAVYEDVFDPSVSSSTTRITRADGFVVTEDGLSGEQTVRVVPYEGLE